MTQSSYFEEQNEAKNAEYFNERRLKSVLSQAWYHNERQENIVRLLIHRSLGYPRPRNFNRKCTQQVGLITPFPTKGALPSSSAESILLEFTAGNNDFGAAADTVLTALSDAPHHHHCTLLHSSGCAALENVANSLKISSSDPQRDPRFLASITAQGHDAYVKASYKLVNCSDDQNYHFLGTKIKETLQSKDCPAENLSEKYKLNHLLSKSLESAKQQRRVLQAKAEERMLRNSPLYSDSVEGIPNLARASFLVTCSSDGKLLASCHGDRSVRVSCCRTRKCIRTLKGHRRTTWAVAFHPRDNNKIATGCLGGEVRVWYKDHLLATWLSPLMSSVLSLSFHPYEDTLAIGCGSALFLLDNFTYQAAEPRTLFSQTVKESVRFVRFSPCGKFLLTAITNPDELGSISKLDLRMPGKSKQTEIVSQACSCGCLEAASDAGVGFPSSIPPDANTLVSPFSGLSSVDALGCSAFDGRACDLPATVDDQSSDRMMNTLRPVLSFCRLPQMFCAINPFTKLLWSDKLFQDWVGLSGPELNAALELVLNQHRPPLGGVSNFNFFRGVKDEFPLNQVHSGPVYRRHYDRWPARTVPSAQNVDDQATLMMVTQVVEEDTVRRGLLLHHSLRQFDFSWPSLDEFRDFTSKKCCISDMFDEGQWPEITTAKSNCCVMQPVKDSCFDDRHKCHRSQPCNSLISNVCQTAANSSNISEIAVNPLSICQTAAKASNISQAAAVSSILGTAVAKSSNITNNSTESLNNSQAAAQKDFFTLFGRVGLEKMQLGLHRANIVLGQRGHWILAALDFSSNERFGFSNTHQGVLCSDLAYYFDIRPAPQSLNLDQNHMGRVRERYANGLVCSFIPHLMESVDSVPFFADLNIQSFENNFHWNQGDSAPSAASTLSIFKVLSLASFQPRLVTAVPYLLHREPGERHPHERSLLFKSSSDSFEELLRTSTRSSVEPFKPLLIPPLHGRQQGASSVQSSNYSITDGHRSTTVREFTDHQCHLLPSTQEYLNSIRKYTAEVRAVLGVRHEIDGDKYMPDRIISWEHSRLDSSESDSCYYKTYATEIPCRSASSDLQSMHSDLKVGSVPQHPSNPLSEKQTVREGLCLKADFADEKLMTEMLTTLLSQEPFFDTQFSDVFQIFQESQLTANESICVSREYSLPDCPDRVGSFEFRRSLSETYLNARKLIYREIQALCTGDLAAKRRILNRCDVSQADTYQKQAAEQPECDVNGLLRRSLGRDKFYERLDLLDRSTSESQMSGSSYYSDLVQAFLSCHVPGTTMTGHAARLLAKHFYQIQRDFFNVFGYVKFSFFMAKDPLSILSWLGGSPQDELVFGRTVPISPLWGPVFPSFRLLPEDCINPHYMIPNGTNSHDFGLHAFLSMRNIPLGTFSRYLFLLPNVLANLNETDKHLQTSFGLSLTNEYFVGLFDFFARGFQSLEFVRVVTYLLYGSCTPLADCSDMIISVVQSWMAQATDLISWIHRINIQTRETKRAGLQQFLVPANEMDFLTTGLCADLSLDRNVMSDIEKIILSKKNTPLQAESNSYKERRLEMTNFKSSSLFSANEASASKPPSTSFMEYDVSECGVTECDVSEEVLRRHAACHCQQVMQAAHYLDEKEQHEPYFLWQHTSPDNRGLAARIRHMLKQLSHHIEDVSKEKLNPTLFPFFLPRPNRTEQEIMEEWRIYWHARSTLPKKRGTVERVCGFPPPGFTCKSRFCTSRTVQPRRPTGRFWQASEPLPGQKKPSTARVQLWPYDSNHLPDIADRCAHLVAPIVRVHYDSNLALTKDWGRIALLSPGLTSPNEDLLGVYSLLEGPTCARGTLLYSAEVSSKVISLSFSPSEAHLLLTYTAFAPEPLGVCQFLQLGAGGELTVLRVVPRFKHPVNLNIASVNCGVWQPTEGGSVVLSCNNGAVLLVSFK